MSHDRIGTDLQFPDELVLPNRLVDYDFDRMPFYARLLAAEAEGQDWTQSAAEILSQDIATNPVAARKCWEVHMERARLAAGDGLNRLVSDLPKNIQLALKRALRSSERLPAKD